MTSLIAGLTIVNSLWQLIQKAFFCWHGFSILKRALIPSYGTFQLKNTPTLYKIVMPTIALFDEVLDPSVFESSGLHVYLLIVLKLKFLKQNGAKIETEV